ncbi:MAG: GNAT family N-acetyltransferase [Flavobacteriaceae bacterium]
MRIIPLTPELISTYNRVGTDSYHEHYLHLWPNANPSDYIDNNFNAQLVAQEIKDKNLRHFLVEEQGEVAGIMKLVVDSPIEPYSARQAIFLEKIYLLNRHSGQGMGKKCISYIIEFSNSLGKEILWLDTMQKGRALGFYLDLGFEIFGEKLLHFSNALQDQRPMYQLRLLLASKS